MFCRGEIMITLVISNILLAICCVYIVLNKDSTRVNRCGDCTHYEKCYKHSKNFKKIESIEQPSCSLFEGDKN